MTAALDDLVAGARARLTDAVAPDPPERRRRRPVLVPAVAIAVVLAAVAFVLTRPDSGDDDGRVAAGLDTALTNIDLLPAGASEALPQAPVPGRSGPAAVWTGTEMIVWGGNDAGDLADGAAYDPRTRTWRVIAPSPLSARGHAVAAWTGIEMVIWGGANSGGVLDDGAAYDPATDTWRTIADGPLPGSSSGSGVWTGTELVIMAGSNDAPTEVGAYDPATDSWRRFDDASGRPSVPFARMTWTGEEAVFAMMFDQADAVVLVAIDPDTGQRRELPPIGIAFPALFAVDGAVVAVDLGPGGTVAILDPGADEWRPLARLPSTPDAVGGAVVVAAGDLGLVWRTSPAGVDSALITIDLRTGAVVSTATTPVDMGAFSGAAVWADGVALVWGGFGPQGAGVVTGAMARPASADGVETLPPDSLPTMGTRPPDIVSIADRDGRVRGTVDLNGGPTVIDGRTRPVLPVHDDDGNLVGYWGCAFLEREEVERDDFVSDPQCQSGSVSPETPGPGGP